MWYGKEDVSAVLQAAIDCLVAEQSYGILYIPEGEYPLKSPGSENVYVRLSRRQLYVLVYR